MSNPFQSLYDACNTGDPTDKWRDLPDFPRIIDVELTNSCNFRCLMCPTGNHSQTRKTGFMSDSTWGALRRQTVAQDVGLRFIGWGEPLSHPRAVDIVDGFDGITHVNTNGSYLDAHMAFDLIDAGLSSIKFSFQGADRETYREMRNIDYFDDLYGKVKEMHWARGDDVLPYIHVSTTITRETPDMVRAFREKFEPVCDRVSVGRTTFDFMDLKAARLRPGELAMLERLAKEDTTVKHHPDPCPEVYDKLSVHWDGSVHVCCNDFDNQTDLGNINDRPLSEIWRHEVIEMYRERLAKRDYSLPLCRDCYDYAETTKKGVQAV